MRIRIAAIAELGNLKDAGSRSIFEKSVAQTDDHRLREAGRVALKKLQDVPRDDK